MPKLVKIVLVLLVLWILTPILVMLCMPIETPLLYPYFKGKWEASRTQHFPQEQDEESERIGFFYTTGFAQAGTEMELLVKYSSEAFTLEKARLQQFMPTPEAKLYSELLNKTYYDTVKSDALLFSQQILHAKPTFYNDEPSWNHGQTYGYAIREETSEILYWVSSW